MMKLSNRQIAREIYLKCRERAKDQKDRTFMGGCTYALEMFLRETGEYDYFNFSEVICSSKVD